MKQLLEKITDEINEYIDKKIGQIEIDDDTDFEIFKRVSSTIERIKDEIEELDEDIDITIEQLNEPSDYEQYTKEDLRTRYMDLV